MFDSFPRHLFGGILIIDENTITNLFSFYFRRQFSANLISLLGLQVDS